MKHGSFLPVLLLLASAACLANGYRWNEDPQELSDSQVAILARNLPGELRNLYNLIVDPTVDEINRENYIWRALELLRYKKYRRYSWFNYWLLDISQPEQQEQQEQGGLTPGGRTPQNQGGRTPHNQGGRTPPNLGGRTPGGRTPPNLGGHTPHNLGGRTPGGRTPKRGGSRNNRGRGRNVV